ncbi:MAG: four helix bundle protein [Candidatus Omnitrophica bacterium]|nr:four helix bundle protein [Candidatus Omnitrophota bacterium]
MGLEGLEVTEQRALQRFQDLDVYREGFRLAMEIFKVTQTFPREELYALTTQLRNASRSVPANIAEGGAGKTLVPAPDNVADLLMNFLFSFLLLPSSFFPLP